MKSRDDIQDEALAKLIPAYRAGVGVTMGGGKTLIGLRHMNHHYNEFARFLVVASKRAILDEWVSQADKHNLSHLKDHMNFTTYLSLNKQDLDYDIVYLDECHSLLYSHEEWLSKYTGKIIGLSGTPPKFAKSEKGKMVAKYCPIIYGYKTDQAISDKILNDYRIIVHSMYLNTANTMKVTHNKKEWYTSEQATYNYWSNRLDNATSKKEQQIMSVMRMKAMMSFPSKLAGAKSLLESFTDKTILFANTQEQADSFGVPSYHSNNPNSESNLELFKAGKIMKLATVLQLNEGVNIPDLKCGIIMHSYGNERKSSQRIGRLLRLNPNDTSTIHILCYRDTIDEKWVTTALSEFDQTKIKWD